MDCACGRKVRLRGLITHDVKTSCINPNAISTSAIDVSRMTRVHCIWLPHETVLMRPNARYTPPTYKPQAQGEVHDWYESSLACSWAIFAFASSNSTVLALTSASAVYSW